MGKLQKAILILALAGRRLGREGDIYPSDVKQFYYGFPVSRYGLRQRFTVADIGFNRYRAAGVAIVKAFQALQGRGLVTEARCSGVKLTGEGAKAAQVLKRKNETH